MEGDRGTRDKLIHFYEGVDLEEVWKMVTSDLPQLISQSPAVAWWADIRKIVSRCYSGRIYHEQG